MLASTFMQGVYASLTQQGSTLLIWDDAMLTFVNFALTDIWTFEGRFWTFQYSVGNTFTTTGAADSFTHTLANGDTIQRLVSLKSERGGSVYDESVKFQFKQDGIINADREVYYQPGATTFKVYDVVSSPIDYTYSFIRGLKTVSSASDTLPVPDMFLPALHSLTLSYCLIPYGQYADNKEVNVYQKGLQQLANLAKYDGMQLGHLKINVN